MEKYVTTTLVVCSEGQLQDYSYYSNFSSAQVANIAISDTPYGRFVTQRSTFVANFVSFTKKSLNRLKSTTSGLCVTQPPK